MPSNGASLCWLAVLAHLSYSVPTANHNRCCSCVCLQANGDQLAGKAEAAAAPSGPSAKPAAAAAGGRALRSRKVAVEAN